MSTCITQERKGGEEEFNRLTVEYAKAISKALTAIAPAEVQAEIEKQAGSGEHEVSLAVDAVPAIRALVTLAGHILKSLPAPAMIETTENCLLTISNAAGPQFISHMQACNASRRHDAMDARANVAGFTRPLRREDYN